MKTYHPLSIGLILILIFRIGCIKKVELDVTKIADTVVDEYALTIMGGFGQSINGKAFQQEVLVSFKNYQYVVYYDSSRHVCVARRKLPAGDWSIIRFQDYHFKSNDAHNTISMGICPMDGTIHLAFDHHGHPLHYRMSNKDVAINPDQVQWEASLFGPVTSELEEGRPITITYPRFLQTPQNGLQFCYRQGASGNGSRMLVDYNPESGVWENTRKIDSGHGVFCDSMGTSDSRCSYPNGYTYGPNGRLHVTWVWREHSQESNHDLIYVYSEDQGNTWLNNNGKILTEVPFLHSPEITVVSIGRDLGLMNTHGQAVDSKGRIHVIMWHCTEEMLIKAGSKPGEHRWGIQEARQYHHYWRDLNTNWYHITLPGTSRTRPKIFIDDKDNCYLIYSDARRRDVDPSGGNLVIMAASAKADWQDWKVVHTEQGPFVNEMLGDYYRWQQEKILSVIAQEMPNKPHNPTRLRILDFKVK